jgi:ketosteroid isomerase-like protein
MSDVAAVLDTLYEYAWAVDECDAEVLADCFTEDAVIDTTVADGTAVPRLVGREGIVEFIRAGRERQQDRRRHLVTNPRVLEEGDGRAIVHSYLLIAATVDGQLRINCTGTYRTEFVLDGGRWRIKTKQIQLDSIY